MSEVNRKGVDLSSVLGFLGNVPFFGDFRGNLAAATSLNRAGPRDLSFCVLKGEAGFRLISKSKAGLIICRPDVPNLGKLSRERCILTVDNPRLSFIRCLRHYFYQHEIEWGVHPTALIDANVQLPKRVKIGAYVSIESGAKIGDGTVMENRVHIGAGTIIGNDVYLQTGCIIGCEGQGFERNEHLEFDKFYQQGNTVIEDFVEIGANSTIVRGTFSETRLRKGSKIGHLTDIGHNVQIGIHTFVSACVLVGGSVVVGDYSWLAPKCCIRNKVKVGKNVTVGLGAVVTKDVEDGVTVVGNPAKILEK